MHSTADACNAFTRVHNLITLYNESTRKSGHNIWRLSIIKISLGMSQKLGINKTKTLPQGHIHI